MADSTPVSLDDLIALDETLTDEEKLVQKTVRRFVRDRYLPGAEEWFEEGVFPRDLIPEIAGLGILGMTIDGYDCAGMGDMAYGLALMELEAADSGLRSFVSVQGSLCMYPIHRYGSEEQKDRWLPLMARGDVVGCFGLTEPDAGSDPGAMRTHAVRDGDSWVLNGAKMWITSAPSADLAVVWATTEVGNAASIRAFLVERGTPGFETPTMGRKMSLRASDTGEIVLADCRIPATNMLPGAKGLGAPLSCLNQARFGIAFGVVGAARACYEAATSYAAERIAFGVPIAAKQLMQHRLVEMAQGISRGLLMVAHFSRMKEKGLLTPWQVSLCKRNNVEMALEVARSARAVLGANGISLEYPVIRHMLNLESVYTYEGTHEVHTLILGRALTGESGF
ncbi:MAG: acyl-CoA dehydrogenase family protein [Gemmatimonadota bacterium]|jgi:glutaryl-CoA dehydrogenase|nr:acyl-CoA dehydrogenase [Gemmatimonadota bacterium]MDP6529878.1 acyl-CoA dehydrogenase family protein [Gemmatimonadota bacterium]MDP6801705.1 acyl-CoA dehydrogenase family protein [Gemmatimonadota bacterium]MDP7031219.1 acyl-CoA dehydrogenase family protein [Gemmatimonadota bacterium]